MNPMLVLNKPLVFEKLIQSSEGQLDQESFTKPLLRLVNQIYGSTDIKKRLQERQELLVARRAGFLESFRNPDRLIELEFTNKDFESGFVGGQSNSGAIENCGLFHDFLSGLIVLPGTSLKGASRAAANLLDIMSEDELDKVYGSEAPDSATPSTQGKAVFLDVLPCDDLPDITTDVLCRHQDIEYDDESPPADWNSTLPVQYLVAKDLTLKVQILLNEDIVSLREKVEESVVEAFTTFGVGAKTSSGYGLFRQLETQGSLNS